MGVVRDLINKVSFRINSSPLDTVDQRLRSMQGNLLGGMNRVEALGDRFRGLKSQIVGVGVAMTTAFSVRAGYDWLVTSNEQMEQYQNTLAVVLKSQKKATDTLAWANKFAAQTPFEIPEIVEATTRLSAYGMVAKDNLGSIGDMASVMGKSLMDAVEAVADAQTGELERLKEFGITKGMLQDQADLLGLTFQNKQGSITNQENLNKALFAIMEDRYKGGMAMQAKTFAGLKSNLSDYIGTLGRQLGVPIFDKLKANIGGLLDYLNALQDNGAIDSFVKKANEATVRFFAIMGELGNQLRIGYGAAMDAMHPIVTYIQTNWASIKPYVQGVAIAFSTLIGIVTALRTGIMAVSLVFRLLSAAMLTTPIGWIVWGLGLLVGWFIKANGGIGGAIAKIQGWFGVLKQAWSGLVAMWQGDFVSGGSILGKLGFSAESASAIAVVVGKVREVVSGLMGFFGQAATTAQTQWPMIRTAIMTALTNVWTFIQTYFMPTMRAIGAVIMFLVGVVQQYWPQIQNIIQAAVAGIRAYVIPVFQSIVQGIMTAVMAIVNFIRQHWTAITMITQTIWAGLQPIIGGALDIISRVIFGALQAISAVFSGVWNVIKGIVQAAMGVVQAIIGTILAAIQGDWDLAWNNLISGLSNVWEGVKTFFGGLKTLFWDSGKAIIQTLADGIMSAAGAVVDSVKSVFDQVRSYLPFSDAHKGPLSELTYNGGKIMTTLGEGVSQQSNAFTRTVADALSGAPIGSAATTTPGLDMPAASMPVRSSGGTSVTVAPVVTVNVGAGGSASDAESIASAVRAEIQAAVDSAFRRAGLA